IEVSVADGADITLDEVAVGTSPLAKPLVVNPGHHKIGATKGGRSAESRVVSVAGADHAKVELTIEEAAPPAPPPVAAPVETPAPPPPAAPAPIETPAPPAAETRGTPTGIWLGWAATGALATGAVVSGILALNANSDLTHAKNDGPAPGSELDRLSS